MSHLHYLAYGSNLHPLRLWERTPSCRAVGVVRLEGWRIAFHKRGADGSGKCDLVRSGRPGEHVYGVLYRIASREKADLDRCEGTGYVAGSVALPPDCAVRSAFAYFARAEYVDTALNPFAWYRDLVLHGAIRHGIPQRYCDALRAVRAIRDPDRERHRRHVALVHGLAMPG